MFNNHSRSTRRQHINRQLAREAITAYRTGRKPDFESILNDNAESQLSSILIVQPYDWSATVTIDKIRLN